MDEERDYVVFTDEEGNEFELDVIGYFDYKDEEYAILADCGGCAECEDENCDECDEDEGGLYIMRIIVNEENNTEEFVPPCRRGYGRSYRAGGAVPQRGLLRLRRRGVRLPRARLHLRLRGQISHKRSKALPFGSVFSLY